MIYQIYSKCYDKDYSSTCKMDPQMHKKSKAITLRSRSCQLLPYRVPQDHYNINKLNDSLRKLNSYVQESKESNKYLATSILFSHGKQETRRFLHQIKQIYGDKVCGLKRRKIMASINNQTSHNKQACSSEIAHKLTLNNQFRIDSFRPDFTIRKQKQPSQMREERRKTMGIQEADLNNYNSFRHGLSAEVKRKQKTKKPKDFKQINMKGFAARISANLQSRQKVSTKTLTRLMNLNIKDLGSETLKKRRM